MGMAAVYTRGTSGQRLRAEDAVHRAALLAAHYRPWAAAVRELVQQRLDSCGRTVLIDVHSYPSRPLPYERHAKPGRRGQVFMPKVTDVHRGRLHLGDDHLVGHGRTRTWAPPDSPSTWLQARPENGVGDQEIASNSNCVEDRPICDIAQIEIVPSVKP